MASFRTAGQQQGSRGGRGGLGPGLQQGQRRLVHHQPHEPVPSVPAALCDAAARHAAAEVLQLPPAIDVAVALEHELGLALHHMLALHGPHYGVQYGATVGLRGQKAVRLGLFGSPEDEGPSPSFPLSELVTKRLLRAHGTWTDRTCY